MNVVDLHPEELIDKELMGELTSDERMRLDAHIAACTACRMERASRDDFRDAFLLEAESGAAAHRPLSPIARHTPEPEAPRVHASSPRRLRTMLLFAAAFLVAGIAAASGASGGRWLAMIATELGLGSESPRAQESTGVVSAHHAPTRPPQPPGSTVVDSSAAVASAPLTMATASVAPAAIAVPAATQPSARPAPWQNGARPLATHASSAASPTSAAVAPLPPTVVGLAPSPPPRTAAAVFAEANDARRRGDYGRATVLYTELESEFGASREALSAKLVLARLLFDRGDTAGALRRWDAYLAASGPLREEAMVGRADALFRLGRSAEESAAWAALLAAYPASAHAARARARLTALGLL